LRRERDHDTGKYIYLHENFKNPEIREEIKTDLKPKNNTPKKEEIEEIIRTPEIAGGTIMKLLKKAAGKKRKYQHVRNIYEDFLN